MYTLRVHPSVGSRTGSFLEHGTHDCDSDE
jgi:hypothetical protein